MRQTAYWPLVLVLSVWIRLGAVNAEGDKLGLGSSKPNIDSSKITTSGVSAGAFMAVQMHVAYSRTIRGVGAIAGGPYWSAQANVDIALALMENPSLIVIPTLLAETAYAATMRSIDPPSNLRGSRLYAFSGTHDSVVDPGVVLKLVEYYSRLGVNDSQIRPVFNLSAEHSMPTDDWGNDCTFLGPDYINNCGYSAAGDLLAWMYGPLKPRVPEINANLKSVDQAAFIPPPFTPWQVGLADKAYIYVPSACQGGKLACALHVAFHGCTQSSVTEGLAFVRHAGYNRWAEANNIVVLYPQAQPNSLNPKGCFDWWGYSGLTYATQWGYQPATFRNMMGALLE